MDRPLQVWSGLPVVVDTSVAFAWFDSAEPGAEEAERLLDAHLKDEIALSAPAHLPLEVLTLHAGRGATSPVMAGAVEALASLDLLIAPLDETLLAETVRISLEEGIPLSAAAFIALAVLLDAPLVTADRLQAATTSCEVRLIV